MELKALFLRELASSYRDARDAYDLFLKSPSDREPVRRLRNFFHGIAGTARTAELPMLGHIASIGERLADEVSLGRFAEHGTAAALLGECLSAVSCVVESHAAAGNSRPPSIPVSSGLVVPDALGEGRELSKIVIIDDDEFSAGLIDNVLRAAGFVSSYCCEPARAMQVIEEELPDLIILDVVMPGLDGFELCRRVRSHPALQLTPIIFVTRRGDVEQRVRGLEVGANDYIGKPFEPQELIARVRSHLLRLANLREMAIRDGLTRCFNHKFLRMRLGQETARARRYGHELSVAMLDVDRFKHINDNHGHAAGDLVLSHLANVIVASVRSTDVVSRYGGEEFAILMVHAGKHEAAVVCERLRQRVQQHEFTFSAEGEAATPTVLSVTVSIGVAELREDTKSWMDLLQQADGALYEAKHAGRNRVVAAAAG